MAALFTLTMGCKSEAPAPREASRPVDPMVAGLMKRAEWAESQGAYTTALTVCDRILRQDPDFASAHYLRGRVLGAVDRFNEAEASLQKVLEIDPDFEGIHFALGNNAARQGRFRKALRYFEAEREGLDSGDDVVKHRAVLLQIGRSHKELGNNDEALEALKEAVTIDPSFHEAWTELGEIYEESGDLDEALHARRKALELDPSNGDYAYYLGALLVTMERHEEAVDHLERAREARPWFYGAWYNLGRSLVALGRLEEGGRHLAVADSLQQIDAALGVARSEAEAHGTAAKWRAYGNLLSEAERYEQALHAYQLALSIDPHDSTASAAVRDLRARLAPTE